MFIVDRITNDVMVCEDLDTNEFVKLPIVENAKEGSYIKIVDNKYIIDDEFTIKKSTEIRKKLDYLKNKNNNNF